MAKSDNVIRILQPPKEAFNKDRPVSELLWMQVEHVAEVVKKKIDDERRELRTEGQASAFVKKYTAFLHPETDTTRSARSSKSPAKKPTRSSKSPGKKQPRSSRG